MAYRAETFRTDTLITVAELAERIAAADPVTVVDVRWRLDRPDGRADYVLGHIPGAVYADLETELSDRSVTGHGRHPLPKGVAVQAAARRWGGVCRGADRGVRRLESGGVGAGMVGVAGGGDS